ncbi:hypothetical protein [Lacibacter sp. H407]|uniref:hypothetical protein n=1 Tax=Lacibacter sp. H407 TaxID=3133423 RepID=UPI0030BFC21B
MSRENKTGLLVFIAAVLLLFVFFPSVMLHPNSSMFSIEGDGLKNYFSVVYYLQNDLGLHFTGMNYPFGEHLSFADGQVALAVPFQYLSALFPQLKNYGFALINISALLSFAVGVWFTYKILLFYKVQPLFAAVGALFVIFFSPQLIRIQAHYGLSYACFFPITWYLSIQINNSSKLIKWSVISVLSILFFGLLHFYLAALSAMFLFCFALLKLLFAFRKISYRQHLANWLTPALGLLLLQLFMFITDVITDRPPRPWGFFYAIADWTSIFLPHPTDLFGNPSRELSRFGEGFAYIGLIPILALLFILIRLIRNLIVLRFKTIRYRLQKDTSLFFLSSIPVLLFSMCIPFIWGLEKLVDYLPFLRQFRVLGRFAWVFYYVAAVQAVSFFFVCYRLYAQRRLKQTAYTLFTLAAVVWGAETFTRTKAIRQRIEPVQSKYDGFTENSFLSQLGESGHYASEFQAILAFPFFHQGSEQFSIEYGPAQYSAMKAAYQLKMPMVNVVMSRTSLAQSCDVMQLLSDSLIDKKILKHFNNKPLLLITSGTVFSEQEAQLIAKAQLLSKVDETAIYLLPVSAFQSDKNLVRQRFQEKQINLVEHSGYWSTLDSSSVQLLHSGSSKQPLAAFKSTAANENTMLFEGRLNNCSAGDTIEFSIWAKIVPANETLPFILFERKNKNGAVEQNETILFKEQTTIYEGCVMLKRQFILQEADDIISLRLAGKGLYSNLLIRKKQEDVFQEIPGFGFYFNNIPVKEK